MVSVVSCSHGDVTVQSTDHQSRQCMQELMSEDKFTVLTPGQKATRLAEVYGLAAAQLT